MSGALVIGLGATGEAVASVLAAEGAAVTVVEEHPGGAGYEARMARLGDFGVPVVGAPGPGEMRELVEASALVVPSPGVPESHPVLRAAAAAGVPVRSEIELAWARAETLGRKLVAVTGTNGKTTVTTLITDMLAGSGRSAVAAGNIGRPLILAVADEAEIVVAEVSSFQLRFTERFRPDVAVFLNVAADHLDWHADFEGYVAAKARVFARQRERDLLVANADDEAVVAAASGAPGRTEWFSVSGAPATGAAAALWRIEDGCLVDPAGVAFAHARDLARASPHDLANALAAAAAVSGLGVGPRSVTPVLRGFAGLPHRMTPVGQSGGVTFVDDSKATNPHAALAALAAYESVVLLAGGRNKGLDLGVLRRETPRIRAVVALGDAAGEIESVFDGLRPVRRAGTMAEAVRLGRALAEPGDTVLLSPACASFDWYQSYAARGDDFARCVADLLGDGR